MRLPPGQCHDCALIVGEFAKLQGPQRWARGYLLSWLTQWRRARRDEQGAEKYG